MEAKSFESKQNLKDKVHREGIVDDDLDYETEEEEVAGGGGAHGCAALGCSEIEKKKRGAAVPGRGRSGGGSVSSPSCQAHNCATDLTEAKRSSWWPEFASVSVSNAAGSMSYQNLMKLKGAVAGGWQGTTSVGGRARPRKTWGAKDQPRSQRKAIAGSWWKIKEAEFRWLLQGIPAISTCISDEEAKEKQRLSMNLCSLSSVTRK